MRGSVRRSCSPSGSAIWPGLAQLPQLVHNLYTTHLVTTAPTRLLERFDAVSSSEGLAIVDAEGAATFAQTSSRARHLARQLNAAGLGGSRVALLAPPGREWVEGFWAILLAGGTVVPLSTLHPRAEQEAFIRQSGARGLLIAEALGAASAAEHPRRLAFGRGRLLGLEGLGAEAPASHAGLAGPGETAPALLLYTSGTTGRPKGAPLSHHNVFEGIRALGEAWEMTERDELIHCLPLHHLHGICVSLLCAFCAGATTRFIGRYAPEQVLEHAAHASVLMGVPTQHGRLVSYLDGLGDDPERLRLSRRLAGLRLITSGSAKLPESLGQRLSALSGQYPLERYGMTEVGIVLANPLHGPRLAGSCGLPLAGCEIRIVDEHGRDVAPGQPGEIWIRGGSVFAGYDDDAAASSAAFVSGFFKSGDTAAWTDEGYVRILGRTSVDIIKSGGYKLSAIEIEEHLRDHPWVEDVAVVGVPDETWGERVVAYVVPSREGRTASGQDGDDAGQRLRLWMKERVAGYQVPKAIVWRDALPRNALGKVQKTELLSELRALDGAPGQAERE